MPNFLQRLGLVRHQPVLDDITLLGVEFKHRITYVTSHKLSLLGLSNQFFLPTPTLQKFDVTLSPAFVNFGVQ